VFNGILDNPVEIDTVKRDLTRNLGVLFPEVYDEIQQAFNGQILFRVQPRAALMIIFAEYIPKTDDWIPIPAFNITLMVVARASNRILVGLPFCRDMTYLTEAMTYTKNWSDTSEAIAKYPGFMKPYASRLSYVECSQTSDDSYVAPYLNKLPAGVKRFTEVIAPEIDRRRKMIAQYGKEYPGKTVC
jgi:hypothetical protein